MGQRVTSATSVTRHGPRRPSPPPFPSSPDASPPSAQRTVARASALVMPSLTPRTSGPVRSSRTFGGQRSAAASSPAFATALSGLAGSAARASSDPATPPSPQPASASAAMAATPTHPAFACLPSPAIVAPRSVPMTAAWFRTTARVLAPGSRNLQGTRAGAGRPFPPTFARQRRAQDPAMATDNHDPRHARLYRWRFGAVEFDEARHELRVAGLPVEIEPPPLHG